MKRKRREQPRKVRKGIYVLPNLLTTASLFFGFLSIIITLNENYYLAACSILISGLFDGLDGKIARLTKSTSQFGVEYDSLADLIAFGISPALLIFSWGLRPYGRFGWLPVFLYVTCGALRLARFNLRVETIENTKFHGLPIPAAASLISSYILFCFYKGDEEVDRLMAVGLMAMIYALSFLMVSNIKYYSFKDFGIIRKKPLSFLVTLILILTVVATEPHIMLFTLILAYVLSGPLEVFYEVFFKKRHPVINFAYGFVRKGRGWVKKTKDKLRDGKC